jgi:Fe-S-cluster containining protein
MGVRALQVLGKRSEAVSARVRDELAAVLREDVSPAAQVRAAHLAHAALDAQGGRVRSLVSSPACSAGCSFCCHVHAEATGPEILAVAAYLTSTLGGDDLHQLRERLAAHAARVAELSDDERWAARIPCALLGPDGRCTVYPVRPLRCRAFHSCDVAVCQDAFEGGTDALPPTIPALDRANRAVEEGFDRALAAAGLSAAPERLEVGLAAALALPASVVPWAPSSPST